jgi:hypothetical protein
MLLPSFQIIRRFTFSTYIAFIVYLDIMYIQVYSKIMYLERAKTSYNLE